MEYLAFDNFIIILHIGIKGLSLKNPSPRENHVNIKVVSSYGILKKKNNKDTFFHFLKSTSTNQFSEACIKGLSLRDSLKT